MSPGASIEPWIVDRAARCGLDLAPEASRFLSDHVSRVLESTEALHLTAIRDPLEFLERHVGESLEGAALIPRGTTGDALDLGSGNGYPGIPVGIVHAGLRMHLTDASDRKAAFLRTVTERAPLRMVVLGRQVQRASDLPELRRLALITSRATGSWERILPRLSSLLADPGLLLLWAGEAGRAVAKRAAWAGLRLDRVTPLPGRDRSWIFSYYRISH